MNLPNDMTLKKLAKNIASHLPPKTGYLLLTFPSDSQFAREHGELPLITCTTNCQESTAINVMEIFLAKVAETSN